VGLRQVALDLDEQYPGVHRRGDERQQDRTEDPVEAAAGGDGQAAAADDQADAREEQRGGVLDPPGRWFVRRPADA
jgi:hypothetical protein